MNEEGLTAAQKWASWHIGDASWAHEIIWAYLNPDEATRILKEEMEEA